MIDLHEALTQIAEIRRHVSGTQTYRGYRAAPVAFSGLLACLASGWQARFLPEPTLALGDYLALWIGAAGLSLTVTGLAMAWHARISGSAWTRSLTMLAVGQFFPAVVAGALMTYVLARFAPQTAWMFPGLWSILFSLGVFSSFRLLPAATFWIGVHYLLAGCLCLALGEDWAFSPWLMVGSFGVGQLSAAAVLYWTLERHHGEV